MVYKGLIVDMEKDYAVAATSTLDYIKITKKQGLDIGKTVLFTEKDFYSLRIPYMKKIVLYAALLLVLLLPLTLITLSSFLEEPQYPLAAVVSVDINPSIELEVDNRYEVIQVLPFNRDAQEIYSQKLTGMELSEALAAILHWAQEKQYLVDKERPILISIAVLREDNQLGYQSMLERIQNRILKEPGLSETRILFLPSSEQNAELARLHQLSIGRYELYNHLKRRSRKVFLSQVRVEKLQTLLEQLNNSPGNSSNSTKEPSPEESQNQPPSSEPYRFGEDRNAAPMERYRPQWGAPSGSSESSTSTGQSQGQSLQQGPQRRQSGPYSPERIGGAQDTPTQTEVNQQGPVIQPNVTVPDSPQSPDSPGKQGGIGNGSGPSQDGDAMDHASGEQGQNPQEESSGAGPPSDSRGPQSSISTKKGF